MQEHKVGVDGSNAAAGEQIGDYEILDCAGVGGSGRVYRVRHQITGRIEAMKILLPDQMQDDELRDRFLREVRVQARLTHPNIASLLTAFRVEHKLVMIMEYVEGESLAAMLGRGRPPLRQALAYASQALAGLGYAHAHGIIHRDVKPENLLLGASGELKVTDFGLAKTMRDIRLTSTGALMGSVYYMSPEQVRGLHAVDQRTDLYSMGAVLYELVTGRRPFVGAESFELMLAHAQQHAVPPVKLDPTIPPNLSRAIMKALKKEPADRFVSAEEFRQEVDAVLAALPEEIETPGPLAAEEVSPPGAPPKTLAKVWNHAWPQVPAIPRKAQAVALGLSLLATSGWATVSWVGISGLQQTEQPGFAEPDYSPEQVAKLFAVPERPAPPEWWASSLEERDGFTDEEPVSVPTVVRAKPTEPQGESRSKRMERADAARPIAEPPVAKDAEKASPAAERLSVDPVENVPPSAADAAVEFSTERPTGSEPEMILPEKLQVRLLAGLTSGKRGREPVAALVTYPPEWAGARVEGYVLESVGRTDKGVADVEVSFSALYHRGKSISIASQVIEMRNSKGVAGVDDNGTELARRNGILALGKKGVNRVGSAIGRLFGGRQSKAEALHSPSTVFSGSAGTISFLPGSEFDLALLDPRSN